ncbi:TolB family protein [Cryomorpha ignava]|uniref:TolB family protein n=1 Tax=Cryomorpha ignava TaxID=101383 RepID=A0A7K3WNC4_9FLAO|nr:DPP IV N-terminal domain-containing protein [Cryomorpha ignava]NEN23150.1 TolB family protein [Cryomorpha ignava]
MKQLLLLCLPFLILASCTSDKGKDPILLITKETGIEQLYKMNGKGNIEPLLNDSVKISKPMLSPDRTKLAYMSEDFGNWDVYIYDLESGETVNVTNSPAIEGFPAWSPNGNKLAFMSSAENNRDIYTSNLDGSNLVRITTKESIESEPLWSPSKKEALYFKSTDGRFETLYRKDLESGQMSEIGLRGGARNSLRIVPGEKQISYIQNEPNKNSFMLFDENEMKNYSLYETSSRMSSYDWSPDGKQVAIAINGQLEVYDYSSENGLGPKFVIENAAYPAWAKSGKSIYYNKRIDGVLQIFKRNLESKKEEQLTNSTFDSTDALPY